MRLNAGTYVWVAWRWQPVTCEIAAEAVGDAATEVGREEAVVAGAMVRMGVSSPSAPTQYLQYFG
jgi:hypothetical protein